MPVSTATEEPLQNMIRQMNRLKDQMKKGYYNFMPRETWTPDVNLYESEAAYLVCVDLSGVDKDKIDLVVVDQTLTLQGQRAVPAHPEGGEASPRYRVHLMEIDHGPFRREVELPHDVVKERIQATYRNGLLWVELPKKTA